MTDERDLNPLGAQPFDAGDPEQVKERERAAKRRERDNREVIVAVLSSPAGRNWMWQILESANVFSQSFVPGPEQYSTVFNEGRRSIGNEMLAQIMRAQPDAVVQLLKEHGDAK